MREKIKIKVFLVMCFSMLCLCSCGHKHTWIDATCDAPKTCSECGEIEGEALEHEWVEATCETPKTCSRCSKTEGEALGHEWIDATFEAPQTCSVCGETLGSKYELSVEEYETYYIDDDTVLYDLTDSLIKDSDPNDGYVLPDPSERERLSGKDYLKGYWGNLNGDFKNVEIISKGAVPGGTGVCLVKYYSYVPGYDDVWNTYILSYKDNEFIGYSDMYKLGGEKAYFGNDYYNPISIILYNTEFDIDTIIMNVDTKASLKEIKVYNHLFNKKADISVDEGQYTNYWLGSGDMYNIMFYNSNDSAIPYIYYGPDYKITKLDEKSDECNKILENSNWTHVRHQFDNVFLVGNDDQWGFCDSDGNVLAMYMDATSYSKDGYAFVSNDRETYDIIDTDFNVILKDVINCDGMSYSRANYFKVRRDTDKDLGDLFAGRYVKVLLKGGPDEIGNDVETAE